MGILMSPLAVSKEKRVSKNAMRFFKVMIVLLSRIRGLYGESRCKLGFI